MPVEPNAALSAPAARSSEFLTCATIGSLFAASAVATAWSVWSMSGGMSMPGDWTMSMMWMRMPGQSWLSAGAVFAIMWLLMMIAMMLPSALPTLLVYRKTLRFRAEPHLALATWCLTAGYFGVWLLFGVISYMAGVGIARAAMGSETLSRAIPPACGGALIVAGAYQLTPWKSACLRHCRDPLHLIARHLGRGWRGGLGLGVHHGAFCAGCCWGLMLIQLALGIMNLSAMVAVAAVISAEKLLPQGGRIARAAGVFAIGAGAAMAARAL